MYNKHVRGHFVSKGEHLFQNIFLAQTIQNIVATIQIRISVADKGGAVVVQDFEQYIEEGVRLISDPEHYEMVEKDPTPQVTTASNKLIDKLKEQDIISESTHRWARLVPSDVRPHVFYHVPKVHKSLQNPQAAQSFQA